MKVYETIFVLNPELDKDRVKAAIEKIKSVIEKKGEIESIEEWGKKRLAYMIAKKFTEGYYVLVNFKAENEVLAELEHTYKISEEYIRHIVVKKEK